MDTGKKTAIVDFSKNKSSENIIAFSGKDNLITQTVTKCGKMGLYFKPIKTEDCQFFNHELYFCLNDAVKGEERTVYEIEVTYHDEGVGNFRIAYEGISKDKIKKSYLASEIVRLTDSKEWKTHKFLIENAKFEKGYPKKNTYDFAISLCDKNMGVSRDGITFGSVFVKALPKKSDVIAVLSTENVGNNFFKEENVKIKAEISNVSEKEQTVTLKFTSKNVFLKDSHSESFDITLSAGEKLEKYIEFRPEFSVFSGKLELINDEVYSSAKIEYSYVHSADKQNERVGINSHSNRLPNRDYKKLIPLMRKAGYSSIRDGVNQDMCFGEDGHGPLDFKPYNQEVMKCYRDHNIGWMELLTWPSRASHQKGKIEEPENTKEYIRFLRESVPYLKNLCHSFEIMNECNLHHLPADWYSEVLNEIYPMMKELAPDHPVVAGVTSYIGLKFLDVMFDMAPNSFDEVSVHPYTFVTGVDEVFEYTYYDHMANLRRIMNERGFEHIPITVTEVGFPTQINFTHPELTHSMIDQAAYTPQLAAIYTTPYLNVKATYFYDFQDDGFNPENLENQLGVIKNWEVVDTPYLAKPAYVSLAWYNSVMADATFQSRIDDERIHLYSYKTESGNDVVMLWSKLDADKLLITLSGNAKVYDMFGNEITSTNGNLSLELDYTPKYIIGQFDDFDIK